MYSVTRHTGGLAAFGAGLPIKRLLALGATASTIAAASAPAFGGGIALGLAVGQRASEGGSVRDLPCGRQGSRDALLPQLGACRDDHRPRLAHLGELLFGESCHVEVVLGDAVWELVGGIPKLAAPQRVDAKFAVALAGRVGPD